MVLVTLASSAFNLVGITVVRYMSIRRPLQHKHILSRKRVIKCIIFVWTLAFIFGIAFYVRPKPGKNGDTMQTEIWFKKRELRQLELWPGFLAFCIQKRGNLIFSEKDADYL
jgi:hypothetical protein